MWPRTRRGCLLARSVAALLTVLVCGGTLDWGHLGGDDPDCNVMVVPHDHAAHRFAANPSTRIPTGDHCYICHSLRLLHVALVARHERVAMTLQSAQCRDAAIAALLYAFNVTVPSRAPPSSVL